MNAEDKIEQNVTLVVVTKNTKIICVYLNGERIAGRKPYASEDCIWRDIILSKESITTAIGCLYG